MPKDQSIPDHLKVEQLYAQVITYVEEVVESESGEYNPDQIRRLLDPVLSMGKAIGRRNALDHLHYPTELKDLRRVVSELHRMMTTFDRSDREERAEHRYGFEDPTINDWLAIADSNVPRETSPPEGETT